MRPKRSLGQNFLTNPHIIVKIIRFADLMPDDTVLEIGPGRGILTTELVRCASRVIAVEKDDKLFAQLKSTFADVPNLTLVHGDILDRNMQVVAPQGAKLLANLPYNIATQIILRLADIPAHFSSIIVMLQKEVGERICASPGTKPYSALSVLISTNFDAVPGFVLGPGNFFPKPKVDSMTIKLIPRPDPMTGDDLEYLKTVVFCAFNQRRKILRNSLASLPDMTAPLLQTLAEQAGIDLDQRPQDLSVEDFKRLSLVYKAALQ